jgi:hypothetical protein
MSILIPRKSSILPSSVMSSFAFFRSMTIYVENSDNSLKLVESENEMGLREGFGRNIPRIDNADNENVNLEICEITHKPKITYTDIVKGSEKKINNPSSHSLKIIH